MKYLTTFYIISFVFVIIQQTTNGIKVERATSSLRRNQQKNSSRFCAKQNRILHDYFFLSVVGL